MDKSYAPCDFCGQYANRFVVVEHPIFSFDEKAKQVPSRKVARAFKCLECCRKSEDK